MIPLTTLEIDGIRISERVAGEGTPVLMLHGWGAHSGLVCPLAEKLTPLGYRVYVPDLPGFGESELPPVAWSVHDYVAFVVKYMKFQSLDKVFLLGHSFGGRLCLVLGSEHADSIFKMVLADASGVRPNP